MTQKPPSEYAAFTSLILSLFRLLDPKLEEFYKQRLSLINYAVVCGVGVLINMAVISFLFDFGLGLVVANAIAIFTAFLWNWTFSVGPYGYLFDLGKPPEKPEE